MRIHQVRSIAALALLGMGGGLPLNALACSCWEFTPIGDALSRAEIVVVATVVRREKGDGDGWRLAHVVVKVVEPLKGDASNEMLITTANMCGGSFSARDLGVGETFVFPTSRDTVNGVHVLPSCSHSALKLVNGELYTNENTEDGGPKLEGYMSLTMLQLLLPLGVLDTRGQFVVAATLLFALAIPLTRRIRSRSAAGALVERSVRPIEVPRSLGWRPGLAVAWMLMCAGYCVLVGVHDRDWIWGLFGVLFAVAAVGTVFRLPWSEGLSYGLALIWIGKCVFGIHSALTDLSTGIFDFGTQLLVLAILLLLMATMIWCAGTVRRRFDRESA